MGSGGIFVDAVARLYRGEGGGRGGVWGGGGDFTGGREGGGRGGSGEEWGDFIATPPILPDIQYIYTTVYSPPHRPPHGRPLGGAFRVCVWGGGKGTVFGRARKKTPKIFQKCFFVLYRCGIRFYMI